MNRKAIVVDTVLGARVGSWHASLDQPLDHPSPPQVLGSANSIHGRSFRGQGIAVDERKIPAIRCWSCDSMRSNGSIRCSVRLAGIPSLQQSDALADRTQIKKTQAPGTGTIFERSIDS
jgi:hypothetical protein